MRIPGTFLVSTQQAALLICLGMSLGLATPRDRRVVDRVISGNEPNEREHAFAGSEVTTGAAGGRTFRRTRAWMRYALTVFDDTEVTISLTLFGADSLETFDLIVENRVVCTCAVDPAKRGPTVVDIRVPAELTRGRTNIMVQLTAHGALTPALFEIRSVQDHNE